MASHQLAIAKASLSASLLKPDPTSLHGEVIAHFHTLTERAITQCTAANVQKCKHWILEHIVPSAGRVAALGKFLTALTTSFADPRPGAKRKPSIKRRRLHVLYIINDILYHAKYRAGNASVCGALQPPLVGLVGSAASFTGCPKHQRKLAELLDLWEEKEYYSKEYVSKLRETVRNAAAAGSHVEDAGEEAGSSTKVARTAPYVMPAMHGDVSTPWFDLPAGNLMPHIVPNSTRPINPDMIKPLRFVAGPADEALAAAVKGLLQDVQKIFDGETDADETLSLDIDELGQPIELDELTGDVLAGEGYYGWSRGFCEKMKCRRKGLDMPRLRSRSSSPGGKRRRRSGSDGSGHRASRRRSAYSSRSPSPDGRRGFKDRSPSPSRSRTYSPRSPRSPRGADARPFAGRPDAFQGYPPPPFIPPLPGFNPHVPPPPPPFHGQQYGSWPIPPPPPNAPWPPPPPGSGAFYQQQQQQPPGGFPGGWTGPPLPPPQQHGSGRGYNAGWNQSSGRGRGGHNRGRGW